MRTPDGAATVVSLGTLTAVLLVQLADPGAWQHWGWLVLLPVLREPATSAPFIALLVPGSSGVLPPWLTAPAVVVVLGAVVLTCVRRLSQRRWLGAVDVALLAAVGLLVAPLAAFGACFGAWRAPWRASRWRPRSRPRSASPLWGRCGR
ncbi:hypothetical protein [Kineococcus sp. SYSU DK002]|uniref:hypothetical protein n=1 Tax=Kineococcus sp. SYSU DK002 TaxID=3383123 RepID=UPI003D7F10F6